jgi:hypothetical protein
MVLALRTTPENISANEFVEYSCVRDSELRKRQTHYARRSPVLMPKDPGSIPGTSTQGG